MADVRITPSVASEPVEHGGNLETVRRRFPQAPEPWIDLSTGINPCAYPVPALGDSVWQRLPTREAEQALRLAAARRYGIEDPTAVVPAPGTQALIQLLPRLLPRSRVAVVGPTYSEHALCWRRSGHTVVVVDDPAGTAGAQVIVVVNPDNPTGRLYPPGALRDVRPSLLVVDEAFIDFLPNDASLANDLPANAIVLRSFGKAYGLAGVRLGFAVAAPPLAQLIGQELGPWAVPGPALEIGRCALEDDAWLLGAVSRAARHRDRLDRILVGAGFTIEGGTPLFCLARHCQARRLSLVLAEQGIHVRTFADRPMSLRFGLPGTDDAFGRLAAALQVPQKVR